VEWLIDRLREEIRSGGFRGGDRLRQVEIAERYGVSTTPVREAFAALERQGLLIIHPHRGAVVFRPTAENVRELYDIRIALEPLATAKAIPNLTAEDFDALEEILVQMGEVPPEDSTQYHTLNEAFHFRIYEAANQPRLLALIASLRDSSASYVRLAHTEAQRDLSNQEHRAILDACIARDPSRAAVAMVAHLEHFVARVTDVLQEQGETAVADRPEAEAAAGSNG
jgi:DNA-binding GntR family transcriptional regulator